MILELTVQNIAILEQAQIRLEPGFSALTGETGAGKSLLIDSIDLALGGRADSTLVRTGCARGVVTLAADLSRNEPAAAKCRELGVELENHVLLVQREVSAEGRSTCRVGGKLISVSVLRQIGDFLVDLHGQHDHQRLLAPETHVGFLDAWIGDPIPELLEATRRTYERWEEAKRFLRQRQSGQRERMQRIDLLEFQVAEIEAVNPQPGETDVVEAQLIRNQHAERLALAASGALATLVDDEGSAVERIGQALKDLESAARIDETANEPLEALRSAYYAFEDGLSSLRAYAAGLEADPERTEELAGRLDALKRLRKKYGDSEEEILLVLQRAREELEALVGGDLSLEQLEEQEREAGDAYRRASEALGAVRRKHAGPFSERATAELRELAMERAQLSVEFHAGPPTPDGSETAEFLFSANAGETLRPLAKIASGGELSRVMLAMKVVLSGRAGVPTLIFDEVDAGLSGKAAALVARKLEALAQNYQVVVISHLPQIAGRAAHHFQIEKTEERGRVRTSVRALHGEERVTEIARMLAGEQVSESALANARDLLAR